NFTNSGTIKASNNNAVYLSASTIETFINENGGIIESESNSGNLNNGTVPAAIYLHEAGNTTIKSFDNQGTIKGGNYVCFLWLSLAHSDINALLCI
ncbi:MAG: hypothetical protein MSA68_03465, partial [Helicobacter sp.]|nr:hypothetical protein [Helicobacter sp.]